MIVGFGRVGRRVGQRLELRDVPYVAIDNQSSVVKRERSTGRPVFYGDARQPDVLKSLGVGDATLVIVAVDDFEVTEQLVDSLRHTFPWIEILVRAHDMEHCRRLKAQGASFTVSENLEASIALARAALVKVTGEHAENDSALDRFREAYFARTREVTPQKQEKN